jgi:hypothetical protein
MIPDCTLVTACFDLTKYNLKSRNFTESINNIKSLLETPCYLVIYTNDTLIEYIKNIRNSSGLEKLTIYIIKNIEELDTFKYLDIVKKNREKYHPSKDDRTCAESHLVCCSKFELVLQTMSLNPFNTSKFGWIDGNVGVNFSKICNNYKNNMLLNILLNTSKDKFHIQILNVNDKKYMKEENYKEYYNSYKWVVCGSLFITGIELGLKILNDLIGIFKKHTLHGYGHAEEMFFLEILDKYYDNIERSYGDYNHILNNFIKTTVGLDYIYINISNKYLIYGYNRECFDCCEKIINQYENFTIELNYELYFKFLFNYYISAFYVDKNKAKNIYIKFKNLINNIPQINSIYLLNKDFYDKQFRYVE